MRRNSFIVRYAQFTRIQSRLYTCEPKISNYAKYSPFVIGGVYLTFCASLVGLPYFYTEYCLNKKSEKKITKPPITNKIDILERICLFPNEDIRVCQEIIDNKNIETYFEALVQNKSIDNLHYQLEKYYNFDSTKIEKFNPFAFVTNLVEQCPAKKMNDIIKKFNFNTKIIIKFCNYFKHETISYVFSKFKINDNFILGLTNENNISEHTWTFIMNNYTISDNLLDQLKSKAPWLSLVKKKNYDLDFIKKYHMYFLHEDMNNIIEHYYKLGLLDLIDDNINQLGDISKRFLAILIQDRKDLIEKYKDHLGVGWNELTIKYYNDFDFIEKYAKYINWSNYLKNNNFTLEVVKKYNTYFDRGSWQSILNKYANEPILYELFGDVIIFGDHGDKRYTCELNSGCSYISEPYISNYKNITIKGWEKISNNKHYKDFCEIILKPRNNDINSIHKQLYYKYEPIHSYCYY